MAYSQESAEVLGQVAELEFIKKWRALTELSLEIGLFCDAEIVLKAIPPNNSSSLREDLERGGEIESLQAEMVAVGILVETHVVEIPNYTVRIAITKIPRS